MLFLIRPRRHRFVSYSSASSAFEISAPIAAPASGASQNSQSCAMAGPSANSATPVDRAGLTEVLVTGIDTRWISVRHSPIAIGANQAGTPLAVAPRMTIRKTAVITPSVTSAATMLNPPGEASP